MKPLMSNCKSDAMNKVNLMENNVLITDSKHVAVNYLVLRKSFIHTHTNQSNNPI